MSKLFIWFKNVDIFEYIENRIISQLNAFLACAQNDLCYNLSETEMNKEDEEIKKEVIILLDSDAEEIKNAIMNKLQKKDKICLIKIGEFEDIIPLELIIDALNENFKYELKEKIKKAEFVEKNTKSLSEIYRTRSWLEF